MGVYRRYGVDSRVYKVQRFLMAYEVFGVHRFMGLRINWGLQGLWGV